MADLSTMKVAKAILDENRHLVTFEVDSMDLEAAELLTKALESYGCTVEAHPFSTRLTVHRPQDAHSSG